MTVRTPHDIEHRFADLMLVLARIEDRHQNLLEQLPALIVPDVIHSGTVQLDAQGGAERFYRAGYGAVTVANPSAANATVALTTRQTTAPQFGPGVVIVPPGAWATLPGKGQAVTIYGTAGALLTLVVMSRACPAAFGRFLT